MSPDKFWDKGGHACALDVSSKYIVVTVLCIMPVSGRFITIIQKGDEAPYGFEVCELRAYGQGEFPVIHTFSRLIC